ncbi:MAG: sigma-70 family RNA polymerase sigma factor [Chloroflexi bacterium]|nr:sigma-70 family RNA polymerase sigma factor [Chloroflexota bacterium]MCH7652489.1 sigma-70 family RNA polymerase sigma factor [Chloroflexota bacterium]
MIPVKTEGSRNGRVSSSAKQTLKLLEVYRETSDPDAREQLVTNYVPLVRRLCRRFRTSREPQEDLFQIGMIGLLNAIEKFDPERGTSFSSLAIPEVLGAILNYLRDHGSLIKIPRTLRRNKLTLDKMAENLASSLGRWPTMSELSEACDLSEAEINAATELGRIGDPRSLDESVDSDDSEGSATLAEYVGTIDQEFDLSLDRLTLATALDTLPDREKNILQLRFYKGMSQRQIAEQIEISQMHVSRLERAALQKLRGVLQKNSAALNAPDVRPGRPRRQVYSTR